MRTLCGYFLAAYTYVIGCRTSWVPSLAVAFLCTSLAGTTPGNTVVRFEYNLSLFAQNALDTVFIELFDDRPLSRDNFLAYVDAGRYDGTFMHRSARLGNGAPFVLQGGGFVDGQVSVPSLNGQLAIPIVPTDLDGNPNTPNPTVDNEYDNSPNRSNVRGTVAYAKIGGNPDSATNQYFFNLGDNASILDDQNGGFTVFAEVLGNGMDLVDAFSGLQRLNLNGDLRQNTSPFNSIPDGQRDPGAFNEVPIFGNVFNNIRVVTEEVEVVNHFGSGSTTNVPGSGLPLRDRDTFIDSGAMFTGPGRLFVLSDTLTTASDLEISHRLSNRSVFAPGLQYGRFTAPGYEQTADGTLEIQIAGTEAGSFYDQLVIGIGGAILDGTLDVTLNSNFTPSTGDEFKLIEAELIVNDFATVNLPTLEDSFQWHRSTTSTEMVLTAIGGDYNGDGLVTNADYAIWKANFNATGTSLAGDGNFDGIVDLADYTIWRDSLELYNTLIGGSGQSAAVPEPATSVLLLLFASLVLPRIRK